MRTRALNWFEKNSRDLPWRAKAPVTRKNHWLYRVWVSEIMLQQTQVQTVVSYFNRFVKRFPSVQALAEAPESDVLTLWEGLGYYRRARSLHAAAKKIVAEHHGKFPDNFEDVLALPGVGRYTAGAILSIVLDQGLPILEGNTYRLHARLLGLICDPRERDAEKALWQFATDLLPGKKSKARSGQLNQALMELGSEVCTVKNPNCGQCPLISLCAAHRLGLENELPRTKSTTEYEDLHQALFILEDQKSRALVRQREKNEWWSGLWDFVRIDVPGTVAIDASKVTNQSSQLAELLHQQFGVQIHSPIEPSFRLKHAVTKYRIRLDCFHLKQTTWSSNGSYQLMPLAEISELPLNVTARKAITRVMGSKGASTS